MNLATSTFSTPKSDLTREGSPCLCTASSNNCRTVCALLFVQAWRKTISRLYPSMPPCITIRQRMSLWWPSICLQKRKLIYYHVKIVKIAMYCYSLTTYSFTTWVSLMSSSSTETKKEYFCERLQTSISVIKAHKQNEQQKYPRAD